MSGDAYGGSMRVSVLIATYGSEGWQDLAWSRAYPSCFDQDADEVCVFHDPEGTIASVRNEVASTARGEWLCFLDADDELAPGYLDAMKRALEQERLDGDLLLTPAVHQIGKGKPAKPFFFPEVSFETGNWLVIGTLVRRDLFQRVGGFHEHPHGLEDWNLFARCVKEGARIVKVPRAVYRAHWSDDSSHHTFMRNRREYMKAYEVARVDAWG